MPYVNGNWLNWSNFIQPSVSNGTLVGNVVNGTTVDPLSAILNGTMHALPWFFGLFAFLLYMGLWMSYADSPSRGKLLGIAAIVFVISAVMAMGGLLSDAIVQFMIFILAAFFTYLLKM